MNEAVLMTALVLLVLLFLKVPVYVSILGGSIMYFVMTPRVNPIVFAQQAIGGAESISLLAIPFFVGAGVLMNYSGVTKRIMDFAEVLTGRLSGGLAQVNVLLSALMGGLSGSNIADAAMQSKMLVPQMREKGFSNSFSSVITATSSMITPLIPPGIAMIIYGSIANVSIGRLFIAGIGIGSLLTASLMLLVSIISKRRNYAPLRTERLTRQEMMKATRPAFLPMLLPIIIIGGIRWGIFTATEAGSVAILFSLFLGILYRELNLKNFFHSIKETVTTTSAIMLIVAAATVFSWILTKERIPQQLTAWIVATIDNKYLFLLIVNVFLLVVGMFIEGNASMIILVPLLVPIAREFGIDDIHFAMTYIFNNAVGALSPPMGTLMFVTCGITKCKTKDFIKEALPFYALLLAVMLLITYVPFFSTFLVSLVY